MKFLSRKWVKVMRNKLLFLTKYSLNKKIKTKWFVIANIAILVLTVALINGDRIVSFFGGDFSSTTEVFVLDNTDTSYDLLVNEMAKNKEQLGFMLDYSISKSTKLEAEITKELEGTKGVAIILEADEDNYLKAKIITDNNHDQLLQQVIITAINNTKTSMALSLSNISLTELSRIYNPVNIEYINLDKKNGKDYDSIMSIAMPILILPFYFLVIFVVQMIGLEITEEKTTKGMEIIISNVSPKTHFFSKIIAANIFVFLQGFLLILYSLSGLLVRKVLGAVYGGSTIGNLNISINEFWEIMVTNGIAERLIYVIPLTLLLFILTFLAYSLIAGILASITVNIEDYQQILGPIMIVLVASFYLAMMSAMFEGSIFIIGASYLPFISALLAPVLLLMGQISVIDICFAILLLLITNYLLLSQGLKVYRVGILNYSTDKVWSRALKVFKARDSL